MPREESARLFDVNQQRNSRRIKSRITDILADARRGVVPSVHFNEDSLSKFRCERIVSNTATIESMRTIRKAALKDVDTKWTSKMFPHFERQLVNRGEVEASTEWVELETSFRQIS